MHHVGLHCNQSMLNPTRILTDDLCCFFFQGNTRLCDHHDDGVTAASVFCEECDKHYCAYCDRFAHLHPSKVKDCAYSCACANKGKVRACVLVCFD